MFEVVVQVGVGKRKAPRTRRCPSRWVTGMVRVWRPRIQLPVTKFTVDNLIPGLVR